MSQASDERRKVVHWIVQCKPDDVMPSDKDVCAFLRSRGYELLDDWNWRLPRPRHNISFMECLCLNYLRDEWDYGWIEVETKA